MTPRIIPIPEGKLCRGDWYKCKYYVFDEIDGAMLDWCELYDCEVEDDRKCPPCAHPEI